MTDNKRKTGIELIRSLHELVCDDEMNNVDTVPLEEICLHLKKNDISYERVITDVRARLGQLRATARLDAARAQRLALANKSNGFTPVVSGLKGKITELLSSMQLNNPQVAAAFFRKFESAPDDDLESLYRDLQELQQLDKDDAEE